MRVYVFKKLSAAEASESVYMKEMVKTIKEKLLFSQILIMKGSKF